MTSSTVWRCDRCGAVLGVVRRDGMLSPNAVVGSIEVDGTARLSCLDCGQVSEWRPIIPRRRRQAVGASS